MFVIRECSPQALAIKKPTFDRRTREWKQKQDFTKSRQSYYPFQSMQCGQSFLMRYGETNKKEIAEVKKLIAYYNRQYHVFFKAITHHGLGIEVTRLL